ncbi:MAG: hypothetical protein QOK15_343 [Nocardioidaceae bacterium]|nr:hypothetical protein [Nocardioidaceae bacterium]
MSNDAVPPPPGDAVPPTEGAAAPPTAGTGTAPPPPHKDPLRGSRVSGVWIAVVALVVLLVLLAIFILQNTQSVQISFLGWDGHAPLAAALLIATALGLLIAVAAGSLRILQLRLRVRRAQKA